MEGYRLWAMATSAGAPILYRRFRLYRFPVVIEKFHIPTDLVVVQKASAVESSPRLDFVLLHNLGTSFAAP